MRPGAYPLAFAVCGLTLILGDISPARGQPASNEPPLGFVALFNGKDLAGWHGMPHFDPRKLAAMSRRGASQGPGRQVDRGRQPSTGPSRTASWSTTARAPT